MSHKLRLEYEKRYTFETGRDPFHYILSNEDKWRSYTSLFIKWVFEQIENDGKK